MVCLSADSDPVSGKVDVKCAEVTAKGTGSMWRPEVRRDKERCS